MSWRWQPPVHSPVSPAGMLAGLGASVGLLPSPHADVAAAVARTFAARRAVLTDSGTSALVVAIRATVPTGGTIALPGYGCIDLSAAAKFAGVRVRLYDLDPATLSPDLDSVRRVLARGIDAIVVAHFYGYPADVPAVCALAAEQGVPVIDDAAQGAGSTLNGVRTGALGDLGVLSFGRGKGTTGGSGGSLLEVSAALAGKVADASRFGSPPAGLRSLIPLAAQWLLARPMLYRLPASIPALKLGEMVYHPAHEPQSISRAAAAVVRDALARDATEVRARCARADQLRELALHGGCFRPIRAVQGGRPGFLRFAVVSTSPGATPAPSLGALRGYPLTLDEHEPLRDLMMPGETAGSGSRVLRDHLFTLPTHSRVTARDLRRLGRWLSAPPRVFGTTVSAAEVA